MFTKFDNALINHSIASGHLCQKGILAAQNDDSFDLAGFLRPLLLLPMVLLSRTSGSGSVVKLPIAGRSNFNK